MIKYEQAAQQTIPTSEILILGLGGAGANMIDRVIIEGLKGPEVLAVNADLRTLQASTSKNKIQLGPHVTRGLGCGGDPEIGQKAAMESEAEIRAAMRGRKIIFLCVGLGGGTGSGAAPLITRIAREENAFITVFATMPFAFEGMRRRAQAETSLNELAVMANALITFDNGRMAELVLAEQGIHEAFSAANKLISESIHAISRIALHPGIVHIGLDDLVTTLSTNRSRCIFGSGRADKEDRVLKALEKALKSPLLDEGKLMKSVEAVIVHICGGETLKIYEAELMMSELSKHINPSAQIFFGVSVDESLGDEFSVTLISSLPEEQVALNIVGNASTESIAQQPEVPTLPPTMPLPLEQPVASETVEKELPPRTILPPKSEPVIEKPVVSLPVETPPVSIPAEPITSAPKAVKTALPPLQKPVLPAEKEVVPKEAAPDPNTLPTLPLPEKKEALPVVEVSVPPQETEAAPLRQQTMEQEASASKNEEPPKNPRRRFAHLFGKQEEEEISKLPEQASPATITQPSAPVKESLPVKTRKWLDLVDETSHSEFNTARQPVEPTVIPLKEETPAPSLTELPTQVAFQQPSFKKKPFYENVPVEDKYAPPEQNITPPALDATPPEDTSSPNTLPKVDEILSTEELLAPRQGMQIQSKQAKLEPEPEPDLFNNAFSQGELELDGQPKGRFEGESPNVYEGEDLDIPTFLRDMD